MALAVLPSQHHLLEHDVDLEVDPSERYAKVWEDFLRQRGSKAFEKTYEARDGWWFQAGCGREWLESWVAHGG